jgi:hypothetical protein
MYCTLIGKKSVCMEEVLRNWYAGMPYAESNSAD